MVLPQNIPFLPRDGTCSSMPCRDTFSGTCSSSSRGGYFQVHIFGLLKWSREGDHRARQGIWQPCCIVPWSLRQKGTGVTLSGFVWGYFPLYNARSFLGSICFSIFQIRFFFLSPQHRREWKRLELSQQRDPSLSTSDIKAAYSQASKSPLVTAELPRGC